MKYYLVNNDFHISNALNNINNFDDNIFFIIIRHRVSESDLEKLNEYNLPYYIIDSPYNNKMGYFNIFNLMSIKVGLHKVLSGLRKKDELFFYTEYEMVNHYLCRFFYDRGCKVTLIEESGLCTYALNKLIVEGGRKSLKEIIKYSLSEWVFGCKNSIFFKVGNVSFLRVDDSIISELIYYNNVSSVRDIPVRVIEKKVIISSCRSNLSSNKLLFLNSDVYGIYMSIEDYFEYMECLFSTLHEKYSEIYFKFHPKEKCPDFKDEILSRIGNVSVLDSQLPAEEIVESLDVDTIGTFMSSSLLDFSRAGYKVEIYAHLWTGFATVSLFPLMYDSFLEVKSNNV